MDLPFNSSIRTYKKFFLKKYFLYIFLGILIFANIILFPDLLNNKDIRLNDMSFLVEHARKQREDALAKSQIKSVEDVTPAIKSTVEEVKSDNNDAGKVTEPIAVAEKVDNNIPEANKEKNDGAVNANETVDISNHEAKGEVSSSAAGESNQKTVTNTTPTEDIKEKTEITPTEEKKENIEIIPTNETKEKNTDINTSTEEKKDNSIINPSTVEKESPKFMEDNSNQKSTENIESSKTLNNNNNTSSPIEENQKEISNENTASINEINPTFTETTNEVIPTPIIPSSERISNQTSNQIITAPIDIVEEVSRTNNHSYLLMLFLVLTAFIISFSIFVYNNLDTIKLTFMASKNPYLRDFIYQGYELLED